MANNPLLNTFNTPFNTVPFNEIKLEHFLPAVKKGIETGLQNLKKIQDNTEEPTFENTILLLESNSEDLGKVLTVYFNLYNSEADEEFQKLAEEISPICSDFDNDIYLNEKIFLKVKSVFENIDKLNLEDVRLTEKYYKSFVRSGALLSDKDKEKMRKIDRELSVLSPRFSKNVLNATCLVQIYNIQI